MTCRPLYKICSAAALGAWLGAAASGLGATSGSVRAWPPPPAEPRVLYSGAIAKPSDVGAKAATRSRIASWLTGSEQDKEQLSKPFGLAVDEAGNLLVTDTELAAVFLLDRGHKKWVRWDSVEKQRFVTPAAIAAQGELIFVADSGLGKVIAFTQKGKLVFDTGGQLQRPTGLAIAGGKLYVTDSQQHEVVVFDLKGRLLSRFGKRGAGPGEFNFPTHVNADQAGNLYVTDALNYRVQVFDPAGNFLRAVGSAGDSPGHFSRPKGVAADTFGHLFVVDGLFDNIQIFDGAGRLLLNLGESGSDPGEFWLPNSIAISRNNEIYVADTYNHRIQVFQFTGKE